MAQTFLSAHYYAHDALDLVAETQNGVLITRTTDSLGRPYGFSLDEDYTVSYAYDMFGRFHSVTSSTASTSSTYTYSYLPNSDLVSGMSSSSGFLWTRAYESARSLITSVENRHGETVISRYDYTNDELGRRTHRADSGLAFATPAFDAYAYNGRSEVTGAQRYHGTDVSDTSTVYGGRQFGYVYDPIGNRTSASETIGGETLAKAYTANALNQYTAIANPDAVGLRGDATNTAVVTVNGEAVQSDNIASDTIPWHFALAADNADGPDFPYAEIVAVVNPPGTNTRDIVSTTSGHLYAPPRSETLTYDDDGNLTSDGRWQYTWNGENRLIKAEELVSPANRHPCTVEYAYDHQGRMVWKQVSTNAVIVSTRTLLWDGYNIVQALTHSQTHTLTNSFTWGLDLSGSIQGAGGIGGLLAEIQDGEPYFAAYDANGNVTEYISTNGVTEAHYENSPFGEIVVQSGDLADSFTHRFSTKPWCPTACLSEYEYRKYRPIMGRWNDRDPLAEIGFYVIVAQYSRSQTQYSFGKFAAKAAQAYHTNRPNLFDFVNNASVHMYDYLGLSYGNPVRGPGGPVGPGMPGNPFPPSPPPPTTEDCVCPKGSPEGTRPRTGWVPGDHVNGCTVVGPGPFDFTGCCNQHDICYVTCNSGKSNCDTQFSDCMSQHCSNVCGTDFWCNFYCGIAEDVYYAGVVDFGGDFYNSGQDQACERCCCR